MNEKNHEVARSSSGAAGAGRGRQRRDAVQWRALIDQQRVGGLSVRAFCKQHGLTESNFYTRRKQLAQSAADERASFVELRPKAGAGHQNHILEVRFACGTMLRCSDHRLADLVHLLHADSSRAESC